MRIQYHSAEQPFDNLALALVPAALFLMILCYIDEGWYSFRWMLDWGNWIVFFLYLIVLTPFFWLFTQFLFPSKRGLKKASLVSLVCVPFCFLLFLLIAG